jgi:hypothetical protein
MIEVDDTKSNAGETAAAARGDERASAWGDERPAARDGERTTVRDDVRAAARDDVRAAASRGAAFELTNAGEAPPASSAAGASPGGDAAFAPDAPDTQSAPYTDSLVLQPDFQAGDRSQYHVAELVAYHDRKFVDAVYKAILRRLPSPVERGRELEDLRGARAGKVEIIERLLASPEARAAGRGVRIEGLPSPLMRRLDRVPVLGYALRLVRALARLPVSMQHQQQFEIYALAQQQRIVDYINQRMGRGARAGAGGAPMPFYVFSQHDDGTEHHNDVAETMAMFSDALVELSNSHADLQARTQTQVEQAQAALTDLTAAITAQQQLAETLRREQQLAADAQQEFLIQEQRVIVETQQAVLAELREELRELSARQQRARDEFDAEVSRLRSLEAAARRNASGQP